MLSFAVAALLLKTHLEPERPLANGQPSASSAELTAPQVAALAHQSSARRHFARPRPDARGSSAQATALIEKADERLPAPCSPLRAAGVLGLLVWLTGTLAWIWRGHGSDGQPRGGAHRYAAAALVGFVLWGAASAFM
jgi:hypothetical protein